MNRRGYSSIFATGLTLAFAVAAAPSCSSASASAAGLAANCSLNSDCDSPLVCVFARCHDACHDSGDCPVGERCVPSGAAGSTADVCQLSQEASCTTATCAGGEVCGADGQCRAPCQTSTTCLALQSCVVNAGVGACYDTGDPIDKVDLGDAAVNASDGATADGSVGPGPDSGGFDATKSESSTDAPSAPGPANPGPGTCVPTGSMSAGRSAFGITPLPDGRVLVASSGTADVYDPATGGFTPTGSPITYPGSLTFFTGNDNALFPLPDGTVLGIGANPNCQPSASAEIYDPATNTWSATGSLTHAREFPIAAGLANGQVLVMGGYDDVPSCGHPAGAPLTSAEIYDPVAKTFTATGNMATPRAAGGQVATLLDGRVFVGIGEEGVGAFNGTAEVYTPPAADGGAGGGTFLLVGPVPTTNDYGYGFTLPGGKVLAGGIDGTGGSTALFDPSTNGFTAGPADLITSDGCGVRLKSGNVFLVTGNAGGTLTAQTEVYQAASGTWTETGNMSVPRGGCGAAELPNGDVLIAGGAAEANGPLLVTAEVCNPQSP
jgi:hypothetical protein